MKAGGVYAAAAPGCTAVLVEAIFFVAILPPARLLPGGALDHCPGWPLLALPPLHSRVRSSFRG